MTSPSSPGKPGFIPSLNKAMEKSEVDLEGQLKFEVESHFQLLKQKFEDYFSNLDDSELPLWKVTRSRFLLDEVILPDNLQDEF